MVNSMRSALRSGPEHPLEPVGLQDAFPAAWAKMNVNKHNINLEPITSSPFQLRPGRRASTLPRTIRGHLRRSAANQLFNEDWKVVREMVYWSFQIPLSNYNRAS
jgi:hypothetical protein